MGALVVLNANRLRVLVTTWSPMKLRMHRNTAVFGSILIICILLSVSSFAAGANVISAYTEDLSLLRTGEKVNTKEESSSSSTSIQDPYNESHSIELDNLTVTLNQTKYRPGADVALSIEGLEDRLHADLRYEVRSPFLETAFEFQHPVEPVFENPQFSNENVTEWDNDTTNSFDNITISNGKMHLILNGTGNATASFNNVSLSGTYRVSFSYQNASITNETLKFYYWSSDEFRYEILNYSTSGEQSFSKILHLNIGTTSDPNGILFAFVLNSTQETGAFQFKNWTIDNLGIENYNWTIFQDSPFAGSSLVDWFNGTNPFNETRITQDGSEKFLNLTQEAGVGELLYNLTSLTGEVIIEFDYRNTTLNASYLYFIYWDGSDWNNETLLNTTQDMAWERQTILTTLSGWNENYTLFRFWINATTSSTWNIDNIRVTPLNEPGHKIPVVDLASWYCSTKTYAWESDVANNTITVVTDVFRNGTQPVLLNITFNLPSVQAILGNWTFSVFTDQQPGGPVLPSYFDIDVEVITELDFVRSTAYARRGDFNNTQPGIVEESYLISPETIFSPGEEIYFIGQLNMTWTNELLNSSYTDIGTFQDTVGPSYDNAISPTWSSENMSINVTEVEWEPGILQAFDPDASNFTDGALKAPYNTSTYYFLLIKIPERGIYGKVNNTVNVKFGDDKPRGATVKTPIELNIRYFVNITRQTNVTSPGFPKSLQLSSWLEGNLTIQPISWNSSVDAGWNASYADYNETNEDNTTVHLVNVTDWLAFPLEDVHFDIFLNSTDLETIAHPFQIRRTGNTLFWEGRIDPNLAADNYTIRLLWTDPAAVGESEKGFLNWAIGENDNLLHLVPITLFGTLLVTQISEKNIIQQGETLEITFNITYVENGAYVGSLQLYANTSWSDNRIQITEANSLYTVSITAGMSEETGTVVIYIFKAQTNEEIGQIIFEIEEREIESTDQEDSPYALPAALIIVMVILSIFGYLGFRLFR